MSLIGKSPPAALVLYDIARGKRSGVSDFGGLGEREGMGTTASGEDIWRGTATTIYSMIAAGGNMSMVTNRMVPAGKVCVVTDWYATEAQNKRVAMRLRSTDEGGTLHSGVFLFKGAMYLNQSGLAVPVSFMAPALSIIKISGWPDAIGADVSAGWKGVLFDV